jgi:hypothetical protein
LAASEQEDLVLLAPPAELQDVIPLSLADTVAIGETVQGQGFGYNLYGWNSFLGTLGQTEPINEFNNGIFTGITVADAIMVTADANADAIEGDSGAPALDQVGSVVGAEIAATPTQFFLTPAAAIKKLIDSLPEQNAQPFIQTIDVTVSFANWFLADLTITLKNTGAASSTTGQYGLCITAHLNDDAGPVISQQDAGTIVPVLAPGEETTVSYAYSLPLGTLAGHYYWFEAMPLCDGCPQGEGCQEVQQTKVL